MSLNEIQKISSVDTYNRRHARSHRGNDQRARCFSILHPMGTAPKEKSSERHDHPSKQVKEKPALNDRKHKSNVQPNPTEIVKPERGIASFLSQITTEIGISKQINPQFRLKGGSIVIQSDRGRM
jgi:hypothetical protein